MSIRAGCCVSKRRITDFLPVRNQRHARECQNPTNATSLMPSNALQCDRALSGITTCSPSRCLSPALRAAHKKVPIQTLRVRTRRISTRKAHRCRNARRRHRSRAISIINDLARRTSTRFVHPPQSISGLFDREDFAGVLLDAAVAFPNTAAFARVLQPWEVGRTFVAQSFGEDVELFLVAGRDGKLDLDGAMDIVDWSAYTSGEAGTALDGRQLLEGECDSGYTWLVISLSPDIVRAHL